MTSVKAFVDTQDYERLHVKFADAVMAHWGLERGYSTIFSFDDWDFKKIGGLQARKPS